MDGFDAEKEVNRLWRAWKTVYEMVRDRGYEVADNEVEISFDEFKARYTDGGLPSRGRMTFSANPGSAMVERCMPLATPSRPDPVANVGPIYIEFAKELTIGVKQMTTFMAHCEQNHFHTGLLVTQSALSGPALRATAASTQVTVQTFREQDLLINITKHILVPKHVVLSPAEKKALLDRYRLKETQLPRIQHGDAVAKYLGLRKGDVVKIIRKSETAGRYASYRWCI